MVLHRIESAHMSNQRNAGESKRSFGTLASGRVAGVRIGVDGVFQQMEPIALDDGSLPNSINPASMEQAMKLSATRRTGYANALNPSSVTEERELLGMAMRDRHPACRFASH